VLWQRRPIRRCRRYTSSADHPYWDGNKRTGARSAIAFMEANGIDTTRLPEQQTYEAMIRVADH